MRWVGISSTFLMLTLAACPEPVPSNEVDGAGIDADVGADGGLEVDGTIEPDVAADLPDGTSTDAEPDQVVTDVAPDLTDVADAGADGDGDGDGDGDASDGDVGADVAWPPLNPVCTEDADCLAYLSASPHDAECMAYSCDTSSDPGVCVFDETAKDDDVCGQSDACIVQAACQGGFCVVSVPTCDDGDPCTDDACDAGNCSTIQLDEGDACDDGVACTQDDACDAAGACAGSPTASCECQQTSDCDGQPIDACNGGWLCNAAYECAPDPANAVVCDTSSDGPCTVTVCNPSTVQCETSNLSDGSVCETGDACIPSAVCDTGVCTGPSTDCSDGKPCTIDTCDPATGGCVYTDDDGANCDDDNPCTTGDVCTAGSCAGPGVLDCNDDQDCTTDQCEPGSGGCVWGNLSGTACEDGDLCSVGDTCENGACNSGTQIITCDDSNDCTDDSCDSSSGDCVFDPNSASCDDGDACTSLDGCVDGECTGDQPDCNDDNLCTADECEDQDGAAVCINTPLTLDPCDDGDPCTSSDFCFEGACVAGQPDPLCSGCATNADCLAFDPTNQCVGTYLCNQQTLQCEPDPTTVVTCSEMETPCTANACDPADGQCKMLPKPEGATCDDGNPCTTPDLCSILAECSGTPKDCGDGEDCTTDQCDPSSGNCVNNDVSGSAVFFDEDFNAGLPTGWSVVSDNSDVGWSATSDEDADGGGMAMRVTGSDLTYNYGAAVAELRLPPTLLQGNTIELSFSVKADFAEQTGTFNKCFDDKDYVQIRIYTSATSYVPAWCLSNSTSGWVDVVTNLAPFSTDVTVAFVFNSNSTVNDAGGVVIDNVRVESIYTCTNGVACVPGICSSGACVDQPHECDDDDPCTIDDCNLTTGACEFTPIPNCECSAPSDCGESFNPCIVMACTNGQCEEQEVTGACDDQSECSENDQCVAGVCTGTDKDCSDGNPCTLDECNPFLAPAEVCFNTPATLPCDDGDACTFNDTCTLAGACDGEVIDCGSAGCLSGTCNPSSGSCEFTDIKHEGAILWSENFEDEIPGGTPEGWEIDPSLFLWSIGFAQSQSAPFALETEAPIDSEFEADSTGVDVIPLTVPADGAWLSFYLYLSRSSGFQSSSNFSDDVIEISINGQLVGIENTHDESFQEVIIDLPAATYGGQDVVFTFVWRNGADSTGYAALDTFTLKAHAPCDDGDVCTSDDLCTFGSCGGDPIPGCTP